MIELVVNNDSPMLGHNSGPPLDTPEILPPSDARPSEFDAKYWSAVNDHIDELMAVAEARAGTKKWGSSFQRTSLLGIAGDIEIARKLPKSEERELEKDRRLWIERGRKILRDERDEDVRISVAMGDPELGDIASARYERRIALLEAEFARPERITTARFLASGVLRDLRRINSRVADARKIPMGVGADGIVVALVAEAMRRAGIYRSDAAVRSMLETFGGA